MLDEVEKLVAEGRSEEEIRNIYVARYGPRILADPPGVSKYWLYLLPFSLLAWFMVGAVFRLRSLVERAAANALVCAAGTTCTSQEGNGKPILSWKEHETQDQEEIR